MARQTQRSQVTSLMTKTHQAVDHQAADHQAVDHQAVDHQEADQQVDDLQNAAKSSTIEGRTIWECPENAASLSACLGCTV